MSEEPKSAFEWLTDPTRWQIIIVPMDGWIAEGESYLALQQEKQQVTCTEDRLEEARAFVMRFSPDWVVVG